MRMSYERIEADKAMRDTALKIVTLLLDSGLTYKKALGTLELSQAFLEETRPSAEWGSESQHSCWEV